MWRRTFMKTKALPFQKVTTAQEGPSVPLTMLQHACLTKDCAFPCALFFFPKTLIHNTDLVVLNWKCIGPPDPRYNVYDPFFTQNTSKINVEISNKTIGQWGQEIIPRVESLWKRWSEACSTGSKARQTCSCICVLLLTRDPEQVA